jgi:outer membrane protein OmpA-like peptidoglycan-associated protein
MRDFMNPISNFSSRKLLATVALTALLSGCSSVPDALNPVEWYKGARDAIVGDGDEKKVVDQKSSSDQSVPGASESFPKLSTVPDRPKATAEEERKRIADGLVADREESRKYSSDVIRRQGDSTNSLPPPLVKPEAMPKPAPTPQPKAMVQPTVIKVPKVVVAKPQPAPVMKSMVTAPKPASMVKPMVTTQHSSSPQLRAAPSTPMLKIPTVNPSSPRMGAIPGLASALGQSETVIISGTGVQTMNSGGQIRRARVQSRRVQVSGVNSLAQFDPNNLQGSYQVATILFANGSAKVGARDRRVLRQVIAQHKKVGGTLRIVGHASRRTKTNDPIRHKMANFQVSTARAERVAKELVKMGVRANKMFVGSVSDSDPKYYEYMPSGEAGNRRTEIYIDF